MGVWDRAEDIDFNALPEQFVLKVNWGAGQNIIVKDKKSLDIKESIEKLSKWMQPESHHWLRFYERNYKDIVPRITAEKYIEQIDGDLLEYKVFCFNGKAEIIRVFTDYIASKGTEELTYDTNWNKLPITTTKNNGKIQDTAKPENFDLMIELSEKLAEGFPLVRIDWFIINGNLKFNEMTFTPAAGFWKFTPQEWDGKLGGMLALPKKNA